ncbi:MAG: hypothetical protein GF317_02080, partial [Candidatus Lokiarchaeota archaeon]|nr:hypothetical protein [Candidatus Lokiarchaeota archaeon]MBD3198728.1 hypothetical protein [Candidatus Lokiarchaeota archaeon]
MSYSYPIEGDYLETNESNLIFDVKGLLHPVDRIISFIRFYPDDNGERIRNGTQYSKIYDIQKRYAFVRKKYPQYLFFSQQRDLELQGVSKTDIKKVYSPNKYFNDLREKDNRNQSENNALDLCNLIKDNSTISDSIGITGSQMVALNKEDSDIDLIVYGTQNSKNLQEHIENIYSSSNDCRRYSLSEYKSHYKFRAGGSGVRFEDFLKSEKRKLHQGKFRGIDFFIRYIKSPEDLEGGYYDFEFRNIGKIKLKARIINADNSIFTPCSYGIDTIKLISSQLKDLDNELEQISEINSYRGRFCEHAKKDEIVYIEGKLEKVIFKKK